MRLVEFLRRNGLHRRSDDLPRQQLERARSGRLIRSDRQRGLLRLVELLRGRGRRELRLCICSDERSHNDEHVSPAPRSIDQHRSAGQWKSARRGSEDADREGHSERGLNHAMCDRSSTGKGSCRLSTRRLGVGRYHPVATYSGSADYGRSVSRPATLTVAKAISATVSTLHSQADRGQRASRAPVGHGISAAPGFDADRKGHGHRGLSGRYVLSGCQRAKDRAGCRRESSAREVPPRGHLQRQRRFRQIGFGQQDPDRRKARDSRHKPVSAGCYCRQAQSVILIGSIGGV